MPATCTLHIYDVTANPHPDIQGDTQTYHAVGTGAFHVALVVYDQEWSYAHCESGSGVFSCQPGGCSKPSKRESVLVRHALPRSCHRESIDMGRTSRSPADVTAIVKRLSLEWLGDEYDLIGHNCSNFLDAFVEDLGVSPSPDWLVSLAGTGALVARRYLKERWRQQKEEGECDADSVANRKKQNQARARHCEVGCQDRPSGARLPQTKNTLLYAENIDFAKGLPNSDRTLLSRKHNRIWSNLVRKRFGPPICTPEQEVVASNERSQLVC